jgi:RNA:NAD 2'-phosphotransferase (TPT1/KptA family)
MAPFNNCPTAWTRSGNLAALHCQPVCGAHQKKENGGLMEPDKLIDDLSKELSSVLKAMSKAKDVNEKEGYSRIVKNLCESLGVFFNLASEMMSLDSDDDLEDDDSQEDVPF